ncbi:hypothetical protein NQ315_008504 [Exocentrus adspersus]|uniref:Ubiquitin thioesterase OTU n=1 Tax=Exocentrus adspersus TaxID=1586481 RepID=A0AAV8W5H5_9CUCU|nr:hypothetical protein NQ315_008504 [Exocentrus adspersus]
MAGFALRVKTKSGHQVVNTLTKDSSIKELKQVLSTLSNIPVNRLQILSGYPPKILDVTQDNLNLANSGITSGDTLILEEKIGSQSAPEEKPARKHVEDPFDCPGILMKNVVPADNSCLFTSVHFVLNGKVDESGNVAPYMRQLVAETIKTESQQYDEAILGKPVDEYCTWIQDDKSWGGAIELAILSNYYGIEIAVVDTMNAIINRFGEDQSYPHRVFLMFDGIHYDPLYMESLDGGKIQTIFSSEDDRVLREAVQLAQEAKSSRQFTDVDKFTLKCMVCNVFLTGQTAAQEHAQQTGHASFGEV